VAGIFLSSWSVDFGTGEAQVSLWQMEDWHFTVAAQKTLQILSTKRD